MDNQNTVAQICKVSAVVIWILGVIVGVIGFGNGGFLIMLSYWGGGFIGGLFLYALGELISIVYSIYQKTCFNKNAAENKIVSGNAQWSDKTHWDCSCGAKNDEYDIRCTECKKLKKDEGASIKSDNAI